MTRRPLRLVASRLLASGLIAALLGGCGSRPNAAVATSATRSPAVAAETSDLLARATDAMDNARYEEAFALLRQAITAGRRDEQTLYDGACAAARAGQKDQALAWLGLVVNEGTFDDPAHLRHDDDLASLRGDPRFSALVERAAKRHHETVHREPITDEALHDELDELVAEDQAVRARAVASKFKDAAALEAMSRVDAKTTARMKVILEQKGWPGVAMVGTRGAHNAWLLVQHADEDLAFQRSALALLEQAVARKDASAADLAYLTDRVLVNEGKPQRYGTQFRSQDGVNVPQPMEDPAHVDALRAGVGLKPLAEHVKQMEQTYRAPAAVR
jgi:hypothetical protein